MTITTDSPVWYPVEGGPGEAFILEGDPINGRLIGNYHDMATAHYKARLHNQHRSRNIVLSEVDKMFGSEISFVIVAQWDGGIDWFLGNGATPAGQVADALASGASGHADTIEEVLVSMTNGARETYPHSTFARLYASDIPLEEDQRTVEDLSFELAKIAPEFDLEFVYQSDPYEAPWTVVVAERRFGGYTAAETLRFALAEISSAVNA